MFLNIIYKLFNKNNERVLRFQNKIFKINGQFISSYGEIFPLLEGFRTFLRPGWKNILNEGSLEYAPETAEKTRKAIESKTKKMNDIIRFLSKHTLLLPGKDILEIGCHNGAFTINLSLMSPRKIVGSDVSKYYINSVKNKIINNENTLKQQAKLNKERRNIMDHCINNGLLELCRDISFVEDDIIGSKFENESFDYIFSIEVLEHIKDPKTAFREMFRILKPGGIAFHEYNPFFCLVGGHSLCTLDFPWGHARLTEQDFVRYTNTIRPEEAELDRSFYFNNLNRMTISDLNILISDAGFQTIEIRKWADNLRAEVRREPEIIDQCKKLNKTVTKDDLIIDSIWVLLKKPG